MNITTVTEALRRARSRLAPLYDTARLDAELLLAHVLERSRTWLYTWPEHPLSREQLANFDRLLEQRQRGVPVAYLTGQSEFWSLSLEVNEATLIPRPETELLVEQLLSRIPDDKESRIAELGTGSGAIAIAVAQQRPHCQIVATDCSTEALATAKRNAARHQLNNIRFRHGSWYGPLAEERFDLIASNPPYIAEGDPHLEEGDLRFEPRSALTAGAEGLDAIRALVRDGRSHLNPGGWLLLEHGFNQAAAVGELLRHSGYHSIQCYPDLAGHHRITAAQAL